MAGWRIGTSIVQALARQLHAVIKIADTNPGTAVSIAHAHLAAVQTEAGTADRAV